MAKVFKQIDTWVEPNPLYAGYDYIGEDGRPLTGYVERETRFFKIRTICSKGRHIRSYKYPKYPAAPEHAMVSWDNLLLCGGYCIKKHEDRIIIDNALHGRKPVGDIFLNTVDSRRDAIIDSCQRAGLTYIQYTVPHSASSGGFITFGSSTPIKDLFNLKSIVDYYREVTSSGDEIASRLQDMSELSPVDALQQYGWASPESDSDLVMTGLCLGYALESTVALINGTN